MKSPTDVLARLDSLAAKDRAWIVAQLPPDAKARLLEGRPASPSSASPRTPVARADEAQISPRHLLAEADAARVCHALRTEPAWVLAAILKVQFWPWQWRLLASLPELTQLEVRRLASAPYTALMLDSVVRLAQQKVASCSTPQSDSRFTRLVAKWNAARVRKRWSARP